MQKTFCAKKFHSFFLTAAFSMAIEYLMLLSDTMILGNVLEPDAIAAANLVAPVFSMAVFLGTLNSIGTSVLYSFEMGKFEKERASELFGQGVILAAAMGITLFVFALLGKNAYFSFFHTSEAIGRYAKDYYFYYQFALLIYPLYFFLLDMIYADGDGLLCNLSYVAQIGINIPLSIFFCHRLGAGGASLGTLIGTLCSILILCVHFLGKKNSLKFRWYVKRRDVAGVIKYGIVDSVIYLCWGTASFVLSKFVIASFGEKYLTLLSVVINTIELTITFDGIGQAITPLINVYRGENNTAGIRKTMTSAAGAAVVMGVLATVVLMVFGGGLLARLLGIKEAAMLAQCQSVIRLVCPFFVCSTLMFLFTTYYLLTDRVALAAGLTVLKDSVLLILLPIAGGFLFGVKGVWAGIGLAPLVAQLLGALFVRNKYGKDQFPLLLEKQDIFSQDLLLTEESILGLRD